MSHHHKTGLTRDLTGNRSPYRTFSHGWAFRPNLLIARAWDRIDEDVEHSIPKAALRGTHESNDRLSDTIRRLMAGQVEVRIVRDGKRYLRSIHLLGTVDRPEDEDEDGNVYYRFTAERRETI